MSWFVAGTATAPILCRAVMAHQNWACRLRMSRTRSPLRIPRDRKYDAAWSLSRAISPNVKVRCSPSSLHQRSARRSGDRAPSRSTTSYPKLKSGGQLRAKDRG